MLLAIDIGNTNIVLGVFEGKKLIAEWRVTTDLDKDALEYQELISRFLSAENIELKSIEGIIISNVVPQLSQVLEEAVFKLFNSKPLFVNAATVKGLKILIDKPEEVGADRLVNALAAYRLYGGPAVVIDSGTAITFCAVSKEAEYLGGAIAPGIKIARDALFERTAQLPRIGLISPKRVIGKNTVEAMRSGLVFGWVNMVEGMVRRFKEELGAEARVVATGGLIGLIAQETKIIDIINPTLTLEGLRIFWEER